MPGGPAVFQLAGASWCLDGAGLHFGDRFGERG
jgi:hypothetical protein